MWSSRAGGLTGAATWGWMLPTVSSLLSVTSFSACYSGSAKAIEECLEDTLASASLSASASTLAGPWIASLYLGSGLFVNFGYSMVLVSTSAASLAFASASVSVLASSLPVLTIFPVSALWIMLNGYFSFSAVFSIFVDLVAAVYLDALVKSGFMFVSIEWLY